MKVVSSLLLGTLFIGTSYLTGIIDDVYRFLRTEEKIASPSLIPVSVTTSSYRGTAVSDVVPKALAFKASLNTTQQATLEKVYTASLARKWSNLPCGTMCRNGIQFSALSFTQLGLALEVIKAVGGTGANEGSDEFNQIRLADNVLKTQYSGGSGYDSTIYFISFLNTPTATGAWMLQYGGHHYAVNIAFNGGTVVGTTPVFEGVEPTTFTVNGTTYSPLLQEVTAMRNMLAGLSASQLTTAKITGQTFSDVTLAPGETNGGSGTFPTTKVGQPVSALDATQQALVTAAIEPWIQDIDDASAATLRALYTAGLSGTYIAYTGNGTSGTPGSFLTANTNYVRIDGPRVWIEFVCQSGVVISSQIHFHSVWRDHTNDYGGDLSLIALPVKLADFGARTLGESRIAFWSTSDESGMDHFEVERSLLASGNFESIGSFAARNIPSEYTFTDKDVLPQSTLYYRLKMIGTNDSVTYSRTVALKNTAAKSLTVYPNPAKGSVSVLPVAAVSNATLIVLAASGKLVMKLLNQNGNKTDIDVSRLPAGTYYVHLMENSQVSSASFIKQ